MYGAWTDQVRGAKIAPLELCSMVGLSLGFTLASGRGHLGVTYSSGLTSCFFEETLEKALKLDLLLLTFIF